MNAVMQNFLTRQFEEGMSLVRESDLIQLLPLPNGTNPPFRYIARFCCTGLVRNSDRQIEESNCFDVGINFFDDYLRIADPFRVLTWLHPIDVWHPNILGPARAICVGRMAPGMSLIDLLYQIFEIITYRKVTVREDDALNRECCQWARQNMGRFPVDARPIKRRNIDLIITASCGEAS